MKRKTTGVSSMAERCLGSSTGGPTTWQRLQTVAEPATYQGRCTTDLENSGGGFRRGSSPARLTKIKTEMRTTGSTDTRQFKKFQIRWAEKLGYKDNPYLVRWTFIVFGYSMRIHHWIKSDDRRHFHDHSSDLLSIVLKGEYDNVVPKCPNQDPDWNFNTLYPERRYADNTVRHHVEGIFNSWANFLNMRDSIWFSKAEQQHYLDIPKGGAWTLMFEGRPRIKWGFFVNGHKWRPLRYFSKFGIIQDKDYQ